MGQRFATASGAVVQVRPDGTCIAVVCAVAPGRPQSAIAGEMLGLELLQMVLARGLENGGAHEEASVQNGADCMAVIGTFDLCGFKAYG